jgi:hypothetical protein
MLQEETRANRVLWAHTTDAVLLAVQGEILAAIPPEELADWTELMLVAGNLTERAELLAGLRAAVPAEVFAALTAPAEHRLGAEAWARALSVERALPAQNALAADGSAPAGAVA